MVGCNFLLTWCNFRLFCACIITTVNIWFISFTIEQIYNSVLKRFRSSHQRCSMQKGVLRHFAKFTIKHLCQILIYNKVADLRPATLLKKKLWYRCFPVNFIKLLRTPFLQNTSGWLLLEIAKTWLTPLS